MPSPAPLDPVAELAAAIEAGIVQAPGFEGRAQDLLDSMSPDEVLRMLDGVSARKRLEAASNRKERRRLQALWRRGKL